MNAWWQLGLGNVAIAALATAIVTCITRIWRNPHLAHFLWALVLVKLITPPLAWIPLSVPACWPWPIDRPEPVASESLEQVEPRQANTTGPLVGAPDGLLSPVEHPRATARPDLAASRSIETFGYDSQTLVCLAWGAGSAIWTTLVAWRLFRFGRLVECMPQAPDAWQQEIAGLARRVGLTVWPTARLTDGAVSPLLWSVGRSSTIVLPRVLASELDADGRRALIAHELAHFFRRDHWMRWLEMIVLALWWWNPVAWWACRQLRIAEEQCCDAWAVWLLDGEATVYGRALLTTLDFLSEARPVVPVGTTGIGRLADLRRRFELILDQPMVRRLSVSTWLVVVPLALVVLGISLCFEPADPAWKFWRSSPAATDADGDLAGVELAAKSYELISIDGLPAAQILEQARRHHGVFWEKRLNEDVAEIMDRLGHRPGETVALLVRDAASGKTKTFDHARIGGEAGAHVFAAVRDGQGRVVPRSQGWARLSPFTSVGSHIDSADVMFEGKHYELVSIDDLTTKDILAAARRFEGGRWMKHFAENLVEVMEQMGHRPGQTVKLVLRDPETGETRTVDRAPMTAENHAQVYSTRLDWLDGGSTPRVAAAQLSPFTKVLISGETADVDFAGGSYRLVSIDNLPTEEILDGSRQYYGKGWKEHFTNDLVPLLVRMGHPPAETVKLVLRDPQSGQAKTFDHAPLTAENYAKVYAAAHPAGVGRDEK